MAVSIFAANQGYLDNVDVSEIVNFEQSLHSFAEANYQDVIDEINNNPVYNDGIVEKLHTLLKAFKEQQG